MKRLLCVWILAVGVFSTACAGTKLVEQKHRSVHFENTIKHLDLGGTFFLYADIDRDLEKFASFFDGFLKEISAIDPKLDLSHVDMPKLVKMTGLEHIQAIGLSSYRTKSGYRNHAFMLHGGMSDGLLKAITSKPHAFDAPAWAPADSDLLVEKDMHLKDVFDVIVAMLRQIHGDEMEQILSHLDDPLPGMRVTYRKLLDNMNTRAFVVVRIGEKMLRIPGESFDFPFVEFALGFDGLAFFFDDLTEALGGMPMVSVKKDDNFQMIQINQALPGDLAIYKPVLVKDVKNGRVFFASSKAFVDEFVTGKNMLGKSLSFNRAMDGLPRMGNGLSYLSDKFRGKVTSYLASLSKSFPEIGPSLIAIGGLLPDDGIPVASVDTNLADGILVASNSTTSHKSTLLTVMYANPAMIGILAAVAIPAFINYQRKENAAMVEAAREAMEGRPMPLGQDPSVSPGTKSQK